MRIKAAGIFEVVKLIILELCYSLKIVGFGNWVLAQFYLLIALPALFQKGSSQFPLEEHRIPFSQ